MAEGYGVTEGFVARTARICRTVRGGRERCGETRLETIGTCGFFMGFIADL